MDFYTLVLRKSKDYWVALCLENGVVAQGDTRAVAMAKLKEAIQSLEDARGQDPEIDNAPVAIMDLHEFLTAAGLPPAPESFELRTLYA